ncbi:acyltransferase family protein [Actinoplanes sp. NPDC048967]|uniref:acyltransferase family protein n=1 Tax=Actinoplanes sp. NPDC048967 TaxID=3155269 RepID=UPI0033CD4978
MTVPSHRPPTPGRRPALDTLRIVVVYGLVFFHAALVFDASDDYYIKNEQTTGATTVLAGLAVVWAMPLLFLVAGIGTRHSMRRRGAGGFAVERLLRLGVPLVFATLTIVPVPPWLRLRAEPGHDESYWSFLLRFLDVRFAPADFPFVLRGDEFETGHLWFVVLLLAFSLLLVAAVARVPATARRRAVDGAARAAGRPGVVLLPAIPIALVSAVLGLEEDLGAWSRWAYLLFFLYGFVLATDERFAAALRRHARVAAVLAVVAFGASAPGFISEGTDLFTGMSPLAVASRVLFSVSGWCSLVALLGLLDRPRPAAAGPAREGSSARGYLAEAALPFYVLHQPVVVVVACLVVPWRAPIIAEYAVVVAISFILTFGAYDLLVRRTRITRFLFGMRPERT